MKTLISITLLFMAVVAINSIAVYTQRRYKLYTHLFGKHDWYAHVIVLSVIWSLFVLSLVLLPLPVWRLSPLFQPLGIVAVAVGGWLVAMSWLKLGTGGVCNGWFFNRGPDKPLKGGVFRLRNPMYSGFALLFVSAAFWLKNAAYLWLAAISFVLLNVIQARVERPDTREN